jgi:hypothetical protein
MTKLPSQMVDAAPLPEQFPRPLRTPKDADCQDPKDEAAVRV